MHLNTNQVFSTEVVFLQLKLIHLHVILPVCIVMTMRSSVSFRWIIDRY